MRYLLIFFVGFLLLACDQHSDYDRIKNENKQLKETNRILKQMQLTNIKPFPLAMLDNNTIIAGQEVTMQTFMGCTVGNEKILYILKDHKSGEYTDTMKPFSNYSAVKTFVADRKGEFTIEGKMMFKINGISKELPFERSYIVQ